jgi:hypothetical protein
LISDSKTVSAWTLDAPSRANPAATKHAFSNESFRIAHPPK